MNICEAQGVWTPIQFPDCETLYIIDNHIVHKASCIWLTSSNILAVEKKHAHAAPLPIPIVQPIMQNAQVIYVTNVGL